MTDRKAEVVAYRGVSSELMDQLRRLFDAEYLRSHGPWNPDLPYGYAPHDYHVIAWRGNEVVGHVGWARRVIAVGSHEVVVAGVGGVLVSVRERGHRLGERLLRSAAESMAEAGGIAFGYLGCREEVVSFYAACGWTRISTSERSISRTGLPVLDPPGQPLFVLPVDEPVQAWPDGEIDLRGRAW